MLLHIFSFSSLMLHVEFLQKQINKHTSSANKCKNNIVKGNRNRAWHCGVAPSHQEVSTGRKCHLNHSHFLYVPSLTPTGSKQNTDGAPGFHAEGAPCWTNVKPALTRKYFCCSIFSWNAEPNTAICPSYLVPLCQRAEMKWFKLHTWIRFTGCWYTGNVF